MTPPVRPSVRGRKSQAGDGTARRLAIRVAAPAAREEDDLADDGLSGTITSPSDRAYPSPSTIIASHNVLVAHLPSN
jgi:hypothetical protein